MYESRGKGSTVSKQTKIWGAVTKVLSSWNTPGLYSFQGSLPRLPLPSVHDTTQRVNKQQLINLECSLRVCLCTNSIYVQCVH